MTERIDHVAIATERLDVAQTEVSANWQSMTGEEKADLIAVAQVHAMLALVEQQRIANLIALTNRTASFDEELAFLGDEAALRLVEMERTPATPFGGPDEHVKIRDDIREGLGLA